MPNHSDAFRFAAVGDSLTVSYLVPGTFPDGGPRPAPWPQQIDQPPLSYAGGWAVSGATTDEMADGLQPLSNLDVLVIMGGTNNLFEGRGFRGLAADYHRIVAKCPAPLTVIAAIPPYEISPREGIVLNGNLRELADQQGWTFIDPWKALRSQNDPGAWDPAVRADGIHPLPHGYVLLAQALRAELLRLLGCDVSR